MNIKFNIKSVVYGVIVLALVIGGFIFVPKMFIEKSDPVDYTMVQREAIPEKILGMMDKYVDEERALAVKLDGKIYVIATRGNDNEHGIEMDKIDMTKKEEKNVMRVKITYKEKEESYPYIVVETNLEELPDGIELEAAIAEQTEKDKETEEAK